MAYLIIRTVLVLIGWGLTCTLIQNLWPQVDPMIFYVAAISWAGAGIAVFGFVCAVIGYIVGRAEGKSLAAFPEPTESDGWLR